MNSAWVLAADNNTVDNNSLLEELLKGNWDKASQQVLGVVIAIAAIVVITIVVRWVLLWIVRRTIRRIIDKAKVKANITETTALTVSPLAEARVVQRSRTIGNLASNVISSVLFIVAGISILGQVGFNVTALIASAGVLGVALSLGAQTLVKDILAGVFMVIEDECGVGDLVDLGGTPKEIIGTVEHIGLRTTHVRDFEGTLWYVRNGEIMRVGNQSQGWSRAIVKISFPFESDVSAAEGLLEAAAKSMRKDTYWSQRMLGNVNVASIDDMDGTSVSFVLTVKTRGGTHVEVGRELRKRIHQLMVQYNLKLAGAAGISEIRIVNHSQRRNAAEAASE